MFTKGHGVLVDGQRAMIVRRFWVPQDNPRRYLVEWCESHRVRGRPERGIGEVMAFDATELHSDVAREARFTR